MTHDTKAAGLDDHDDAAGYFCLEEHLARQRRFSEATFGPGSRVDGVTDHISKELKEVRDSGGALTEWVDVIILAFDGAWRSGASPREIINAMVAKQTKNEGRRWPDWRTADPGKAIEHDRSADDTKAAEPALPPLPPLPEFRTVESPWKEFLEWAYLPWAHPDACRLADAVNAALGKLMQDYAREAVCAALSASTQAPAPPDALVATAKKAVVMLDVVREGLRAALTTQAPQTEAGWLHRLDMEKSDAWRHGYEKGLKRAASPAVERDALVLDALQDMLAGWKYIRSFHGDLYGVGWDRAQQKAEHAVAALANQSPVEREALLKLARYGAAMLHAHRGTQACEVGDIDGGTAQDKALECGVLEPRTVTEPCGQSCECADFPGECYFMPAVIRSAISALANQAPGEPT